VRSPALTGLHTTRACARAHAAAAPQVVTPDLKLGAQGGALLHVDLASVPGARRLGGSALAQAYSQVRARRLRAACCVLRVCVCVCVQLWCGTHTTTTSTGSSAYTYAPPCPRLPVCAWLHNAKPIPQHKHTHTHTRAQIGNECPDVEPAKLKAAWGAVQSLVDQGLLSAGHDVSDGGVATALLEMAFAGACVGRHVCAQSRFGAAAHCVVQRTLAGGHTRVTRMSTHPWHGAALTPA
jgi:hypothetical protein